MGSEEYSLLKDSTIEIEAKDETFSLCFWLYFTTSSAFPSTIIQQVFPIDELVRISLQVVTNKPPTHFVDDIFSKFIPPVDNNNKPEDSGSNKNIKY
ncbi:hypothetical protein VIGAN_10116000 [Vigna angularis var. angularis]|uniref:Uncharacterized protein n=1 Tax=Vigna angularis var. angularis TaxID=157739 RepID=A0A0S3T3S9_PHAAN|nr:hypothetical protein VIGAN_10116000 [Vigna angularis var. angularis]